MNIDLNAISQTVDNNVRTREICTEGRCFGYASDLFIAEDVSRNTNALCLMVRSFALGIRVADQFGTGITASAVAVLVVRTVGVGYTFWRVGRTDTDSSGSKDETFYRVANASAIRSWNQLTKWITNACSVESNESLFYCAIFFYYNRNSYFDALLTSISGCSWWTRADHGSVRS